MLTLHPYRLPLTEAVVWGGVAQAERLGVLVRVETETGAVGWGDVAPLPGFSRETLAAAVAAVERLDGASLDGASLDGLDALPSAARFGVELARADAQAQDAGRTLAQAFAPDPAVTLPLAGLILGGTPDAVLADAERLARAGYTAVKLKVGRGTVAADAALVRSVRDALGPGVALRLDANRAWSAADARRFADAVAGVVLEFVEEPLADAGPEASALAELWLDTGLPLALDETLQEPGSGSPEGGLAALRGWAAAAVVKPTLGGGLAAARRIADAALAVGVKTVVSASFESGVGMRGLVALAAATGGHAAGLDTYRWLARDVLAERLPLARPTVDVPGLLGRPVRVAL